MYDRDDEYVFETEVLVTYDLPDATVLVSIEIEPHDNQVFDVPHMHFTDGLRESITTYCQLHHHYKADPDLLAPAEGPVGVVQYYTELAFAHAMIDELQQERSTKNLSRRVLLLHQLIDSLKTASRRNAAMSQTIANAERSLRLTEEFDIHGSMELIHGMENTIPRDFGRYLPTDPELQNAQWEQQLQRMNEDCLDYPCLVFVDDTQTYEDYEAADCLDDKSKLMVSIGDFPLTWDDVREGRRIFPHSV